MWISPRHGMILLMFRSWRQNLIITGIVLLFGGVFWVLFGVFALIGEEPSSVDGFPAADIVKNPYFTPPLGVFEAVESGESAAGFSNFFEPVRPISEVFTPFTVQATEELVPEFSSPTLFGGAQESEKALSDKEIFHNLFPDEFIDGLQEVQDLLIKQGEMKTAEGIVFDSEDNILLFMNNLLDLYVDKALISAENQKKLSKSLNEEFPQLLEREKAILRGGSESFFYKDLEKDQIVQAKKVFLDGILQFFLKTANAQISGLPGWVTVPDCYKSLVPLNPAPGVNLWAFCCNCGLRCTSFGCIFIPDCGPFSAACNIPLGCLNLTCGKWPNAVWDQFDYPLGTGICGCG